MKYPKVNDALYIEIRALILLLSSRQPFGRGMAREQIYIYYDDVVYASKIYKPRSSLLTLVEIRVRIAKSFAFLKSIYGLGVRTNIVERAVFYDQTNGLIPRQTFGSAQTMVFFLDDSGCVTLFATSVVIDSIFRTIANIGTRVIGR